MCRKITAFTVSTSDKGEGRGKNQNKKKHKRKQLPPQKKGVTQYTASEVFP